MLAPNAKYNVKPKKMDRCNYRYRIYVAEKTTSAAKGGMNYPIMKNIRTEKVRSLKSFASSLNLVFGE